MTELALPGMGRIHEADDRDLAFPLHRLTAAAPAKRRSKTWTMRPHWINQGDTGTCVGHGWRHELLAYPVPFRLRNRPRRSTSTTWRSPSTSGRTTTATPPARWAPACAPGRKPSSSSA
jgi:hypothetical protein